MQSKIIIVLLFILSFNIVHDTVIHITDKNEALTISEYVDTQVTLNVFVDLDDIHSVFHFDAVSNSYLTEQSYLGKENRFFEYLAHNTSPYLQRSSKPPIA